MAENTVYRNCGYITRRIGATTYRVKVVFDDTAKETMNEKIIRLIQYEVLDFGAGCDTMTLPQMSRQSERSA